MPVPPFALEGLDASAGPDRVDARDLAFVTIDPEGRRGVEAAEPATRTIELRVA